ncbi:MAG: tetratricopeptide repeat protein [Chloroflexi bacterium]|nr:tetratricopeptide repeat protein [Chloroflexota bacterium]
MFIFKKDASKQHWERGLKLRDPYRKEYDLQEAISHFKRAISENPRDYRYRFDLARTYLAAPELAVTRGVNVHFKLEEAVALAIPELKEAVRLNPKDVASRLNLAHSHIIQGDKAEAETVYMEYLKATKQKLDKAGDRLQNLEYAVMKRRKPNPEIPKAEQHLQQALELRRQGKYKKAAKELQKAYAVAPDVPWVYKRLYKLGKQ